MALKTKLANCFPQSWNKFLFHHPSLMQWTDGLQGAGPWLGKSLMSSMDWPLLCPVHRTCHPNAHVPPTSDCNVKSHFLSYPSYNDSGLLPTSLPRVSFNKYSRTVTQPACLSANCLPRGMETQASGLSLLPTASQPCHLQEEPLGVVLAPWQDYSLLLGPCPPWQGPVSV